jgi:hypothetical protein
MWIDEIKFLAIESLTLGHKELGNVRRQKSDVCDEDNIFHETFMN